jgi:hemin uptake protein HemP
MTDQPPPSVPTPPREPAPERVIRIEEWLKGQREICIEHDGVRYRLRVTRRNRLILQK